jgi:vacuolar-type H+-ATPase subunit E/Vma4
MGTKMARQLWGRDFDIVKEGLDESQVAMFITELIGERDELLQRQDHLASLTKLAERTVAEADKLAADIRKEIEEESQSQAAMILAKAEKEAQELMEQKRAEILDVANKEAQEVRNRAQQEAAAIKAQAQQEVEHLVNQQQQRVQEEVKEMAQKLHSQLMAGLKGVTEQATALQAEWESKLSVSLEGSLSPASISPSPSVPVTEEPIEEMTIPDASEEPVEKKAALDTPEPEPQAESKPQEKEKTKAELKPQTEEKAQTEVKPKAEAGAKAEAKNDNNIFEQLEQAWEDTDMAEPADKPEAASAEETADNTTVVLDEDMSSATYEGRVALDILPPLVPNQLVEIHRYLRDWPGIGIIELGPSSGGYSITLSLDRPMPLIDVLKQLPDIEAAEERVDSGDGNDATDKKGMKRIAITLRQTK